METAPVREHFQGEPARPECTVESGTIEVEVGDGSREYEIEGTIPYPEAPTEFTESTLADYVEAFETAYATHSNICHRDGYILNIDGSVSDREILNWYDGITVVYVAGVGRATRGLAKRDGEYGEWVSTFGRPPVASYAIDHTGAARVQSDHLPADEYALEGPDPLVAGELLVTF